MDKKLARISIYLTIAIFVIAIIWGIFQLTSKFGEHDSEDSENDSEELEDDSKEEQDDSNELEDDSEELENKSENKSSGKLVYIFTASWCGHCKTAMPEFKKAASSNKSIKLIDSGKPSSKALMLKYKVNGFPTIVSNDGEKYSGQRTSDGISSFANS